MTVPNPFQWNEEVDQFLIEQFKELIPEFREKYEKYSNFTIGAKIHADTETRQEVIAALRSYAEEGPWGPFRRGIFRMLVDFGAKDLDVTPVVDEVEKYKDYPAEETKFLFDAATAELTGSVHPRNFDQLNRFFSLQSSISPDPLAFFQHSLIWYASWKSQKFREDSRFLWLVDSRFAGAGQIVDEGLERIAQAQQKEED
ncbi:hypothetical protein [Corynebacterium mayonis]|uniref:hypothetical protein n=1 Tax=Corynebacterium mayonis TaxID=3062461 RepID=UPI0031403B83